MTTFAGALAAVLYLAAAAIIYYDFHHQRQLQRGWVLPAAGLAAALHVLVLLTTTFVDGGINLSFYAALSLVSWVVVVLLLAGELARPMEALGAVIHPLAAILLLLHVTVGQDQRLVVSYGWQIDVHIAVAVFSYAILSIAAAQAVMLAAQESALRRHRFGGVIRVLPPMDAMERLLFQLITLGFALLTLTLISGMLFVDDLMAQHLVHKTVLSGVGWIVFASLLWGRWRYGWRGRTAIRMTLIGMIVLLLAYFGSKLVLELILHRVPS